MSVTIAVLSLAIAGLGLARYLAPEIASMPEGTAPILGLGVVMTLAASFAVAMRLSRPVPGRF